MKEVQVQLVMMILRINRKNAEILSNPAFFIVMNHVLEYSDAMPW